MFAWLQCVFVPYVRNLRAHTTTSESGPKNSSSREPNNFRNLRSRANRILQELRTSADHAVSVSQLGCGLGLATSPLLCSPGSHPAVQHPPPPAPGFNFHAETPEGGAFTTPGRLEHRSSWDPFGAILSNQVFPEVAVDKLQFPKTEMRCVKPRMWKEIIQDSPCSNFKE